MTPIAHTVAGFLGWKLSAETQSLKKLTLFVFIANIPDIDFLFNLLLGEKIAGLHQYYTHNVFFVLICAMLLWPWFKNHKERLALILTALSHLLLDLLTIDAVAPIGIRLFYPFSTQLFNMGIFPNILKNSWEAIFSLHNLITLSVETTCFVIPVILFYRKEIIGYLKIEQWKN